MVIKHWRNLIILCNVLICLFASCEKTKVYWNDLRDEKENVKFTASFSDSESDKYKNITLKTDSTKAIHLQKGYVWDKSESSSILCMQIFQNADNTKIEIFLTDNEQPQKLGYDTVLKEKDGVYCYYISFADNERKLICTLFSKDNNFNVNPTQIKINNETNIKYYLSELEDRDIGYYYEIEEEYIDSFMPSYGYFVESKTSEYLLQVPAGFTGRILPIIKKDDVIKKD